MMAQKGGGASGRITTGGMKKRTVEIPSESNKGGEGGEGEVLKLVKATTPKELREVKNVLRWYAFLLSHFHLTYTYSSLPRISQHICHFAHKLILQR
jgi:hypothetical protein